MPSLQHRQSRSAETHKGARDVEALPDWRGFCYACRARVFQGDWGSHAVTLPSLALTLEWGQVYSEEDNGHITRDLRDLKGRKYLVRHRPANRV